MATCTVERPEPVYPPVEYVLRLTAAEAALVRHLTGRVRWVDCEAAGNVNRALRDAKAPDVLGYSFILMSDVSLSQLAGIK